MVFRMSVQHEYADCLALLKVYYRTAGKASRVGQLLLAAWLLAEIVYASVVAIPKHGLMPEIAVVLVLCALGIVFLMLSRRSTPSNCIGDTSSFQRRR